MSNIEKAKQLLEWLVNESGVTSYRIKRDTGVAETTARRLLIGESKIDNLPLKTATELEMLATKLKEESVMEKVMFEGNEYTLTQEAYMAGTNDHPHYEAHAVDADGNEYVVQWDVVDNWRDIAETGDQSDMCDWDNPVSVESV